MIRFYHTNQIISMDLVKVIAYLPLSQTMSLLRLENLANHRISNLSTILATKALFTNHQGLIGFKLTKKESAAMLHINQPQD